MTCINGNGAGEGVVVLQIQATGTQLGEVTRTRHHHRNGCRVAVGIDITATRIEVKTNVAAIDHQRHVVAIGLKRAPIKIHVGGITTIPGMNPPGSLQCAAVDVDGAVGIAPTPGVKPD